MDMSQGYFEFICVVLESSFRLVCLNKNIYKMEIRVFCQVKLKAPFHLS